MGVRRSEQHLTPLPAYGVNEVQQLHRCLLTVCNILPAPSYPYSQLLPVGAPSSCLVWVLAGSTSLENVCSVRCLERASFADYQAVFVPETTLHFLPTVLRSRLA